MSTAYGMELILDLRNADVAKFSREAIDGYFETLCSALGLERADLHFWDYEEDEDAKAAAPPHLKGVSAIQFVTTSSIVVHTLDDLGAVLVNIFSCGTFDPEVAERITLKAFGGEVFCRQTIVRGEGLMP